MTNLPEVNFLDATFDVKTNIYRSYRKPNNTPSYIHMLSNHPPEILKRYTQLQGFSKGPLIEPLWSSILGITEGSWGPRYTLNSLNPRFLNPAIRSSARHPCVRRKTVMPWLLQRALKGSFKACFQGPSKGGVRGSGLTLGYISESRV